MAEGNPDLKQQLGTVCFSFLEIRGYSRFRNDGISMRTRYTSKFVLLGKVRFALGPHKDCVGTFLASQSARKRVP